MPNPKIEKVEQLLKLVNEDFAPTKDVVRLVGEVIKTIAQNKKITDKQIADLVNKIDIALEAQNSRTNDLNSKIDKDTIAIKKLSQEAETSLKKDIENLRQLVGKLDEKSTKSIQLVLEKAIETAVARSKKEIVIPEPVPQMLGEDIRNALEALNGEDRLNVKAIDGLEELIKKLSPRAKEQIMAANRYLYELLDVDVSGITPGQSIMWNGITWTPYTAATEFFTETPVGAIDGVNTTYTVAHDIGTVMTFAINGMFIHPNEYIFTGDTITMATPLDSSLSGTAFTIIYS